MDYATFRKEAALERFNHMMANMCKLIEQGQAGAAQISYHTTDGFLMGLLAGDIITTEEYGELSKTLFHKSFPA